VKGLTSEQRKKGYTSIQVRKAVLGEIKEQENSILFLVYSLTIYVCNKRYL